MPEVRIHAFAKINLSLRVFHKRPDNFHELRTIFQTISLSDVLSIQYEPAAVTRVTLESSVEIADNLVNRAANAVLDAMQAKAHVHFRLEKKIPMGGGLGGGSTDAAAVLLALPVLAGRRLPLSKIIDIASALGSDVPFFLLGGTALGLGRGEELYPFPEPQPSWGVLVTPEVHVSTPEAFRGLGREMRPAIDPLTRNEFQFATWKAYHGASLEHWNGLAANDFEQSVFDQHPELGEIKKRLHELGAEPAMMTGSGAAIFGFCRSEADAQRVAKHFERAHTFRTISRKEYQDGWSRDLGSASSETWPPAANEAVTWSEW